jgi:lipopolysaccharide export LptBFGC system permease protein LptF
MANLRHPNLFVALAAVLLGVVAIALYTARKNETAGILIVIAMVLGVVHWIWSIIDVSKTTTLQGSQKKFWLIAVIAIPFGGTFYYLMHSKRNTIVD